MAQITRYASSSEAETRLIAGQVASRLRAGDLVYLWGELGAGKTTFVRGLLESLGHVGPVRSPTFNLIQTFNTDPPVMHADLYRVQGFEGIGIEDYLDGWLCLIEWPDRAAGLALEESVWQITISFEEPGRVIEVAEPTFSR